ncbi:MAG: ASCH domain-containing protein [Clostridia bacterium]|nr:ASCH domain-containing protein [Clostridia bacterium]
MKHCMKLQHSPFLAIKSGRKTVEMRLYDEKRSLINEGDMVEFTDVERGEKLLCRVVKLHRYASFEELYSHHDKTSIGYAETEEASPQDMLAYYPIEEVQKYGVVGIEIQVV